MRKYKYDYEIIKNIVSKSLNFSEVLRKLNIPNRGNNIKTLKNFIIFHEIDYSHFTYEKRIKKEKEERPIEDYLNNKVKIKTYSLKIKLIKNKLLEYKCHCCGINEWNNKPIVLQLHHIDGNSMNNNLSNLQLLCPNCHSQTENFSGKSNKPKEYNYCKECGTIINKRSTYCVKCAAIMKRNIKLKNISKEELINKFLIFKSFIKVGEYYNVSDNTIRKICLTLGLPNKKKEMEIFLKKLEI